MITRRDFLIRTANAGAGFAIASQFPRSAAAQTSETERNKAIVRAYKETAKTKSAAALQVEYFAPNYKRLRGGLQNLANNAEGQGFPDNGEYLRGAIPDRNDIVEEIVAEGDKVGMLWRVTGTHRGPLFGIPPTGKAVNFYEAGIFKLAEGKIVEAWFLGDEAGLLKQLGAKIPPRKDGRMIVPPVTNAGEDPDAAIKRIEAGDLSKAENRNRLIVARSKGSATYPDERAPDFKQLRFGFQHMRDFGIANGTVKQSITEALPDRRDRIDGFLAEGNKVWMLFKVSGTQSAPLYGVAPTNRRVELPEIGIMTFAEGKWKQAWYFGDELGMMLQLDALHMLQA
jgi:predicted ester cyclase